MIKLEFTTTSSKALLAWEEIPWLKDFLCSFQGLKKLFVFCTSNLPWDSLVNHTDTLEVLNFATPNRDDNLRSPLEDKRERAIYDATLLRQLFSKCHRLRRLAMQFPGRKMMRAKGSGLFWEYMVRPAHLHFLHSCNTDERPVCRAHPQQPRSLWLLHASRATAQRRSVRQ